MKHNYYSYFFHTCLIFSLALTACKTMRTSEKAVSQSETASVTETRLTFYRTLDSLSRQLSLSADSITMIFNTDSQTLAQACLGGSAPRNASRNNKVPHAISIYGLHLNENIEKKSIEQAELKDSVTEVTQSQKHKSASKQKTAPSTIPQLYLFLIFIILIIYIILYLKRRFL